MISAYQNASCSSDEEDSPMLQKATNYGQSFTGQANPASKKKKGNGGPVSGGTG
jgi:hypothetical protein